MQRFIIFLLLSCAGAASAQPKLPAALQKAVLQGWQATHYASGDLNGDRQADAALIIQQQNPALRLQNDGLGWDTLDTNPRRLLVLLRDKQRYRLLAQSPDSLLPPSGSTENPCLEDPLGDDALSIKRGRLWLAPNYWLSCGSYGVLRNHYQFRYQNRTMQLIGIDSNSFSRATHEESHDSANLLSGKIKTVTGINLDEPAEHHPREQWRRITRLPETDLQRMTNLPEIRNLYHD